MESLIDFNILKDSHLFRKMEPLEKDGQMIGNILYTQVIIKIIAEDFSNIKI